MKMCACDASSLSYGSDDITLFYDITWFDIDRTEMSIQTDYALTMVEIDHVTTEEKIAGLDDGTVSRRFNGGAFRCCYIETTVWSSFLVVKKSPEAEGAAGYSFGRP